MIAIAYLIPFLSCLLLSVAFHYQGEWTTYLWLWGIGELVAVVLHIVFHYNRTHATEYLGSLVNSVHHEEEWIELVPRTVTRRDSRGNTYTTVQIVEQRHPERYYFYTTRGTRLETNRLFFTYVLGRWTIPPVWDRWTDRRIKGGVRYGSHQTMNFYSPENLYDDNRYISITEKHRYKNKIRNSNSIFRFRKIAGKEARNLNLYDYPGFSDYDIPCILDRENKIPWETKEKFRRFNGAFACANQMRLFVLVFNSSETTAATAVFQREYWQGGNKNEFVVCLGVNSDNEVEWAECFSWADSKQLEAETTTWFLKNKNLNLDEFYSWFIQNYSKWKRKEFSDFKYIWITLSGYQTLCIVSVELIGNAVALYLL